MRQVFEIMRKHHRAIGLCVVLLGVLWTYMSVARNDKTSTLDYLRLYSQVYRLVQDAYLEETDPAILVEGTIEGMAIKANPYNSIEPLSGSSPLVPSKGAVDCGLILGYSEPFLKVIDVLPGSPADAKGIPPGSLVLRIADQSTPYLPILRAQRMLTGEIGSKIELVIQNACTFKLEELSIELAAYSISPPVSFEEFDWGIMCRITGILTQIEIDQIISKLQSFSQNPKGMILDLRHYNADSEEVGLNLADLFIKDGVSMADLCQDQNHSIESIQSEDGFAFVGFNLILLCDQTSAGAAETCALAIRNTGRGKIVGEKTFGRTVKFAHERLEDAYLLHIVTAYYGNSACETPHGKGLVPDVSTILPQQEDGDALFATAVASLKASMNTL